MTKGIFPTHIDLMWPTLEAIKQLGGSGTNQEILDKIIEIEEYPESIQAAIQWGTTPKLQYRAGWARSFLKMAGIITNSKAGIWSLMPEGENIPREEILRRIKVNRQNYRQSKNKPTKEHIKHQKKSKESSDENSVDWKMQLLECIRTIEPAAFERLCQRILRESGFIKVEVIGRSGDRGIDGVGVLRLNLLSFQVLFQCKRYQGSVGASAVRDFRGGMVGRCDKGLLITTGSFTAEARREATRDGATIIDLIDGDELCVLLKKLNLGVHTQQTEQVIIESGWFKNI